MSKRYREPLDEVELDGVELGLATEAPPVAFAWRGRHYRVQAILGHWHEEPGWWRRGNGLPERIERADLWRVEVAPGRGVYELVRQGDAWRLDRVWD